MVGTLYGDWLKKVVDEALSHRNTKAEEEEKGEFVLLDEKVFKDLQHTNFLSSKWLQLMLCYREAWPRGVPLAKEDCRAQDLQGKEAILNCLRAVCDGHEQSPTEKAHHAHELEP